ncbi:MAG TPA: LysR family transcriptional regulator substrate-binding protein, partial [Clostridia bacterium]|nr:LysR family transcriptional regulator substrate-binding protein [Clostridia bacterium]
GREVSIHELVNYPLIMLERKTATRQYIDDYLLKHSITLEPEFELATSDLIVEFACRGLGVSCVVRDFAREDIEKGVLFEIDLKEKIPARQIAVVALKNVPLTAAAKKFMELLQN